MSFFGEEKLSSTELKMYMNFESPSVVEIYKVEFAIQQTAFLSVVVVAEVYISCSSFDGPQ